MFCQQDLCAKLYLLSHSCRFEVICQTVKRLLQVGGLYDMKFGPKYDDGFNYDKQYFPNLPTLTIIILAQDAFAVK